MKLLMIAVASAALAVDPCAGKANDLLGGLAVPKTTPEQLRVLKARNLTTVDMQPIAPLSFHEEVEGAHRMLLSRRMQRRELGWKKIKKRAKKAANNVGNAVDNAADSAGSALDNWANSVAADVKDAAKSVGSFLGGTFVPRQTIWNEVANGSVDSWKKVLKGFDSMEKYFENQFVDDLEWLGKKIGDAWDAFCGAPLAQSGLILTCSYGLNVAYCAATGGVGPFCVSLKLYYAIVKAVGEAIVRLVVKCGMYHGLKQIDALCNGRAMAAADTIASAVLADPFTPVCSTAVTCSCGECPWMCNYEVGFVCNGNAWKEGALEIGKALAKIA